jgi:hypothetical protein
MKDILHFHSDPSLMFTEEFQKDFYTTYHAIFDNVSSTRHPNTGYLAGELHLGICLILLQSKVLNV